MTHTAKSLSSMVCAELGYSGSKPIDGLTCSDADIATAASNAYLRHLSELPQIPMGNAHRSRKAARIRERMAKRLIVRDVADQYKFDYWAMIGLLGVILAIFGGPMAVVIAIISAVLRWYIERELDGTFSESELRAAAAGN